MKKQIRDILILVFIITESIVYSQYNKGFLINIPEGPSAVFVDDGLDKLSFFYDIEGGEKSIATLYIRNGLKTFVFNDLGFVLPFAVHFGGTGVFVYMGLFSNELKPKHIDSAPIGDRAKVDRIHSFQDIVTVRYFVRNIDQSFGSDPKIPIEKKYRVSDKGLQEIKTFESK